MTRKFKCETCGPQDRVGDFGSEKAVLCLNCVEEIPWVRHIEIADTFFLPEKY